MTQPGLQETRQALLRSGRTERPSTRALPRTLVALGLTAGGAGVANSAAATGLLVQAFAWKWAGIGILAGLSAVGTYQGVQALVAPKSPTFQRAVPTSGAAEGQPAVEVARPPLPAVSGVETRVAPTPTAVVSPTWIATAPSASWVIDSSPVPTASSRHTNLASEIQALDQARRALAAGDAEASLRALDSYSRDHPTAQLDHEAFVIRLEAMIVRGDCAAAAEQGEQFLRAHSKSPVEQRVRTLIAQPCR